MTCGGQQQNAEIGETAAVVAFNLISLSPKARALILIAGCRAKREDSGLSKALAVLTQALPDQATSQSSPNPPSPASSSTPSSSPVWRQAVDRDSADADSSSDESSAAQAGSSTAWQFAEENVRLHALILRHMCQQGTDAQTAPDQEADDAAISQPESSQATLPLLLSQQTIAATNQSSPASVNILYSKKVNKYINYAH